MTSPSSPNAKGDAELVERPKLAWVEFAGNGNVRYWSMDEATARRQIAQGHKLTPFPMVPVAAVADLLAENARLIQGARSQADEVMQTLGKVLGYPWFKDDQTNFPGATEADGICPGDHIAETMAAEAAEAIARLTREVEEVRARAERLEEALRPFAIYAEHMPGRDIMRGEIGEYYRGGFRVSISTDALERAVTALSLKETGHGDER